MIHLNLLSWRFDFPTNPYRVKLFEKPKADKPFTFDIEAFPSTEIRTTFYPAKLFEETKVGKSLRWDYIPMLNIPAPIYPRWGGDSSLCCLSPGDKARGRWDKLQNTKACVSLIVSHSVFKLTELSSG